MIAEIGTPATPKPTKKRGPKPKVNRPALDLQKIYSRKESAYVLGLSQITLFRAFDSGHLQGYRAGRNVKHSGQQLLDWLQAGGRTAK